MIGYCKLCFDEIENDEHAVEHFGKLHGVISFDAITIEELIQD